MMLMILAVSLFSQNTPIQKDYLQKSKSQKSGAWVLLSAGVALMGTGLLIGDSKKASFDDAGTGIVIGGIGFLATLGSIPTFISSAKNKKKANSSAFFKMETTPVVQQHTFVKHSFPAIAIKISL